MITAVTHATRYIPDLDAATEFYRSLLGFQVVTDNDMSAMMGRPARWLTLNLPSQPGFEIVLQEPAHWLEGESLARTEAAMGVQPQIILSTDDITELHARLRAAGVPMPMGDPGDLPWGRDLLFKDPSGSNVYVIQPHAQPSHPSPTACRMGRRYSEAATLPKRAGMGGPSPPSAQPKRRSRSAPVPTPIPAANLGR